MARSLTVSTTVLCILGLAVAGAAPSNMMSGSDAGISHSDVSDSAIGSGSSASSATTTTTMAPASTTTMAPASTTTTMAPASTTTTMAPSSTTTMAPASTTTVAPTMPMGSQSNNAVSHSDASDAPISVESGSSMMSSGSMATTAAPTTTAAPPTPAPTVAPANQIFTVTFSTTGGCSYNQNTFVSQLATLVNKTYDTLDININAPNADKQVVFYFEGPKAWEYAEVFEDKLEMESCQTGKTCGNNTFCVASWSAVDQEAASEDDKKKSVLIYAGIGIAVVVVLAIIVALIVRNNSNNGGTGQSDHSIQEMNVSPTKPLLDSRATRDQI